MRNSRRTKAVSLLLFAGLTVLGAACDDGADTDTTTDTTTGGTADTTADTTAGDESPADDESPATTTDS